MGKNSKLSLYLSPDVTAVLQEEHFICSSRNPDGVIDEKLSFEGEETF